MADDAKQKSIDDLLNKATAEKYGLGPLLEKIKSIEPFIEKVSTMKDIIKGDEGKTPVLGEDYLNDAEQKALLDAVTPKKGIDYDDGAPGDDGYSPVKGVDYMTEDDLAAIKKESTPVKGQDYFTDSEAESFKKSITPIKGQDYTDGENPTPAQFLEVIKGLKGKDAAAFSQVVGAKIDISHVRNAGSFMFNGTKYDTSELMHGGGSGGGAAITLQTNGTNNGSQTLLNLKAGTNVTLTDNGSGTVTIAASGSGGGSPGGLNTQLQYNNNGAFGGITNATTDGSIVSLSGAHLLNPTINGAGAGLATLTYPNTATSVSIAFPATAGTVALTSDLTGFVTAVTGTTNRITSSGGTTPAIDISASYVGQTSITTLGTVATGTWAGTTIAVLHGGTGTTTSTGSGSVVLSTSPTLVTPVLGVATATSLNGLTVTTTTGTLTIAAAKVVTVNNTLTFTGTDGSSVAFGAGGTVLYGNQTVTLSGDITGSGTTAITTTLATVNANVGSFGSATQVAAFTVNAKGLTTAASNITITPAVTSITGLGTGVATALAIAVGSAGAFVTFNGAGGTPSSITLTNGTGLPIAGITGLGTGIGTWLATPSSANLAAAITDETGTGKLVFATKPTFIGTIQTITAIGALALDGSTGNMFTKTIATGSTFTQSNFSVGQNFTVTVSGAFTITWFSTITWFTTGGTAPTQAALTTYGFTCTGTNTFNGYLVGTQ